MSAAQNVAERPLNIVAAGCGSVRIVRWFGGMSHAQIMIHLAQIATSVIVGIQTDIKVIEIN